MLLTPEQINFLDYIETLPLTSEIFRTGGTALAWKYNHRLSTDLDFFSEQLVYHTDLLLWIQQIKKHMHYDHVKQVSSHNRQLLFFQKEGSELKSEVTFFPFPSLYPKTLWKNSLQIDNPIDIGINKIHAISERDEPKDVFDVYYICKNEDITVQKLTELVEEKFGVLLNYRSIIARGNHISK